MSKLVQCKESFPLQWSLQYQCPLTCASPCCRSGALVAIDCGFMGPNYSISTACATANYAFVAAANHIRSGDADVMLAGGTEAPIIPVGLGGFVACR